MSTRSLISFQQYKIIEYAIYMYITIFKNYNTEKCHTSDYLKSLTIIQLIDN